MREQLNCLTAIYKWLLMFIDLANKPTVNWKKKTDVLPFILHSENLKSKDL